MIKNFTFLEMLKTDTGIQNFPLSFEHFENLKQTTERLQIIRDKCGFPIIVTSAYRNDAVNKAVGGAKNSYHTKGLAVDCKASTEARNRILYDVCRECMSDLGIDQLIMYNEKPGDKSSRIRFLHIGFATDRLPRRQLLFL